MTINSLINFGIPGIAPNDRAPPLQPIMSNKFRITFYDFGNPGSSAPYVVTQQVRSTQLPTLTFGVQTLYAYVSTIYIATRAEWSEMSIRFLDDITDGVMGIVYDQCAKQQNMFNQTTSLAGGDYKFEMDLDILAGGATAGSAAGDPNILRRYSYAGCFITSLNGSEMAYATPDGIEFEVRIRYDNVVPFDFNGNQMGNFTDVTSIAASPSVSTTGIGAAAGSGVAINANSVSTSSAGAP